MIGFRINVGEITYRTRELQHPTKHLRRITFVSPNVEVVGDMNGALNVRKRYHGQCHLEDGRRSKLLIDLPETVTVARVEDWNKSKEFFWGTHRRLLDGNLGEFCPASPSLLPKFGIDSCMVAHIF